MKKAWVLGLMMAFLVSVPAQAAVEYYIDSEQVEPPLPPRANTVVAELNEESYVATSKQEAIENGEALIRQYFDPSFSASDYYPMTYTSKSRFWIGEMVNGFVMTKPEYALEWDGTQVTAIQREWVPNYDCYSFQILDGEPTAQQAADLVCAKYEAEGIEVLSCTARGGDVNVAVTGEQQTVYVVTTEIQGKTGKEETYTDQVPVRGHVVYTYQPHTPISDVPLIDNEPIPEITLQFIPKEQAVIDAQGMRRDMDGLMVDASGQMMVPVPSLLDLLDMFGFKGTWAILGEGEPQVYWEDYTGIYQWTYDLPSQQLTMVRGLGSEVIPMKGYAVGETLDLPLREILHTFSVDEKIQWDEPTGQVSVDLSVSLETDQISIYVRYPSDIAEQTITDPVVIQRIQELCLSETFTTFKKGDMAIRGPETCVLDFHNGTKLYFYDSVDYSVGKLVNAHGIPRDLPPYLLSLNPVEKNQ